MNLAAEDMPRANLISPEHRPAATALVALVGALPGPGQLDELGVRPLDGDRARPPGARAQHREKNE